MTPSVQRPVWVTPTALPVASDVDLKNGSVAWSDTSQADGAWPGMEGLLEALCSLADIRMDEPRVETQARFVAFFQTYGVIALCSKHGLPWSHQAECESAQTNSTRVEHLLQFARAVGAARRLGLATTMRQTGDISDWVALARWRNVTYQPGLWGDDYTTARNTLAEWLDWLILSADVRPHVEWVGNRLAVVSVARTLVAAVAIMLPRDINSLDDRTYVCDVCGHATVRKRAPKAGEGVFCEQDSCQREKYRRNTARSRERARSRSQQAKSEG